MKTILFPTDFSDNSMHAAQYAGMLARRFDAKLIIVNVFSNVISLGTDLNMINETTLLEEQLHKNSMHNLEIFSGKVFLSTELPEVQIEHQLVYGFVTEGILEMANAMNVDMIVMGTKGVSNVFDKWMGSNAESVIKAAKCPVWVVPTNAQLTVPQLFIYAADLEEDEVSATKTLLDFSVPLGATCKVIHIQNYFDKDLKQKSAETMADLSKEFDGNNITFKDLKRNEIVEGIETYTRTHKPDVLALAVYDKNIFSNLFNSSITKHFVEESKIPILIFKKEKL
ncbi:universal stress protein [Lacihabitans soyangensis]|uniref:Universal stress protein n=1 Tax=Lacihabitans soyangensis TaxID=869394 RepID=A0AAE3H6U0_9BACT|nr:universal stress protein [Lacihabitans soyangensis]MCP9765522.1 universal stress protein [Lacihabitans soyangensis]